MLHAGDRRSGVGRSGGPGGRVGGVWASAGDRRRVSGCGGRLVCGEARRSGRVGSGCGLHSKSQTFSDRVNAITVLDKTMVVTNRCWDQVSHRTSVIKCME